MKHIKKFNEHYFPNKYDFGRFEEDAVEGEVEGEQDFTNSDPEDNEFANKVEDENEVYYDENEVEEEEGNRIRRWGDEEVVEKKKVNPGFQAYLDKQKGKKVDDKKGGKKSKPDFLDLDKDGDKKEPMKKAAKDAKEDEKEVKGAKGLTAKQKKLPAALQASILKKQK